jgi:hypothetical protein
MKSWGCWVSGGRRQEGDRQKGVAFGKRRGFLEDDRFWVGVPPGGGLKGQIAGLSSGKCVFPVRGQVIFKGTSYFGVCSGHGGTPERNEVTSFSE